ncbi:MAG TPA: 50S ribosomal protein L25 [Phototrophicaceae bacterium]|nr:50S ribosomal protein L25 [Phototrophicaceae bacterium]
MADFSIEAQPRSITGKKVSQVRNQGLVPGTIYGPKSQPVSIQVPYRPLEIALTKAGGTNLIDLVVEGKTRTVLAREVQRDPIKRTIRHIDFYEVDLLSKIRTSVPLHFVGESPVVAQKRGVLITGPAAITIEVLPTKLLHVIEVDLSSLKNLGDSVTVADLKLGDDIHIVDDPEEMLAKVIQTSAARSEEDEAAELGSAEPEVITKGKGEEEDF